MALLRCAKYAFAFLVLIGVCMDTVHADLTRNQVTELEEVFLPAYQQGDTFTVLESLCKVVRQMSDEQLSELDIMLVQQDIPPSSELLVQSRLSLLEQGYQKQLPKPGLRESVLMLEHINAEIAKTMEAGQAQCDAIDQLTNGESFADYESILWDTHVLQQQLSGTAVLAQYAGQILKSKKRFRVDDLEQADRDLLDTDFGESVKKLENLYVALGERELVGRIKRLTHARDVLQQDESLKDGYLAAWAVDVDGDLVKQAFHEVASNAAKKAGKGSGPTGFQTEFLNSENLADTVDKIIVDGRELAGEELLAKSRLLFTGMHWWMRGRYGMGPDGFGLLKSEDALRSEEAQFALYMPVGTPEPTNPQDTSRFQVPEIDRRHHYIWAWEYRQVGMQSSSSSKVIARSTRVTQETGLTRFY